MAILENKAIRGTLSAVFKYTNNPEKNIPADGLSRASAYIRGEHSIERLYSRGHNGCSSNPELALQQFRACEVLYRQKKAGAVEPGLTSGKQPIIAEHFFLSFPTKENVPYRIQCEIADKLCSSEILRDFYAVSNRHYNTDNDHTHILVSNISRDGSRKLSMNKAKRQELRKELDRICALDYGLSIIDSGDLRYNDPERVEFVHSLVGKVYVYAPADYERVYANDPFMMEQVRLGRVLVAEGTSKNRRGKTQADAYRRWIAEQEDFHHEVNKKAANMKNCVLITEQQAKSKAGRVYYYDPKYRRGNYYYAVRRYDKDGKHKSMLTLIAELVFVTRTYDGRPAAAPKPRQDYKVQALMDTIRLGREQGVRTPIELQERIKAVGAELVEVRRGKAYYEKVDSDFGRKKVADLIEQEKKLKKDYHDLKFIESKTTEYQYQAERASLDFLIKQAQDRSITENKNFSEKFQKTY